MKSTKLDLTSQAKPTPRLSRLLKGNTAFDFATEDHLPYFWAGYKTGAFKGLIPELVDGLSREEFTQKLENFIYNNALTPYSFFADIDGVSRIIGLGMFWVRGRVMQTENLIWFDWSTPRIILQAYVNFINTMRKTQHADSGKTYMVLEFAQEKDARYFDHVCKYGIMRRVGTSHEIYNGQKCCIYESRSIENAK